MVTLTVVALLSALAGVVGGLVGYYLRFIISLGEKGSIELSIKQMMIDAEEKAKKIIGDAETNAAATLKEVRIETKDREEKLKQTENRLIKKDELLDRRQQDVDKEVEIIKSRIAEIRAIRENAATSGPGG